MNSKRKFVAIMLVFLLVPATGQHSGIPGAGNDRYYPVPDTLVRMVLDRNKSLQVARELYQVASMEARTGNAPPNPQVEFGYLFGKPDEMGNRIDFAVTQEIDFPTAYLHRSRARDLEIIKADLGLDLSRQEILLQASKLWIERIYLNQMERMIERRLQQSDRLLSHYEQQMTLGEIGQLAFSQSNLQSTALRGELQQIRSRINENQAGLEEITAGAAIIIPDTVLPRSRPIDPDSLKAAYRVGPMMQYFRQEIALKEQKKQLTTSLSLPRISAGYYSESVLAEQFKGFQVGISVPLWENSNRIKLAKTEVIFAEADADRMASLQQKELNQFIEQWQSLDQLIGDMERALSRVNDIELLNLAWEGGEISLSEYMTGSDLYFRNLQSLISYRKDQLLVEVELRKVYY
jgi:outer membrane protein TolC